MQFTCKQSELSTALSLVSRAVPAKPSHQILENILVDVRSDKLLLTAFDMSLGINLSVEAKVQSHGAIAVPSKALVDIVSKLPDADVTLSLEDVDDGQILRIKCKRNKYDIRFLDASEFPELPSSESKPIAIQSSALAQGLKACIFAASGDESKGSLTGVNLQINKDTISFGATDGHRLSTIDLDNECGQSIAPITIPAKSLIELEKMISKSNAGDEVQLFIDNFQIIFAMDDKKITTRALESAYPNYKSLIPAQFERIVVCDRKELISSIDRLSALSSINNTIAMHVNSESNQMTLTAVSQSVGTGEEVIDIQVTGDSIAIGVNGDYFLAGLKAISSSDVQININQPLAPIVITPIGGSKMRYLLMPVMLKD